MKIVISDDGLFGQAVNPYGDKEPPSNWTRGYAAVIDSLNNTPGKAWLKFYKEGEAKWVADTLKNSFKHKP